MTDGYCEALQKVDLSYTSTVRKQGVVQVFLVAISTADLYLMMQADRSFCLLPEAECKSFSVLYFKDVVWVLCNFANDLVTVCLIAEIWS